MTIDIFLTAFVVIVIMVGAIYPILGLLEMRKLKFRYDQDLPVQKVKFFYSNILWAWIPVIIIFIVVLLTNTDFRELGFKWIELSRTTISSWIKYSIIGIYIIYFLYCLYSIISLKTDEASRQKIAKKIPEHFRLFLPVTKQEKNVWILVAITAGVAEEIIYRGYFFYCLSYIFPGLSIHHILFLTTLIFGIGHLYLGMEVIKSTILGLIFGIFYIVFDSLIPVILIHVLQDLSARDLLSVKDNFKTTTNNN